MTRVQDIFYSIDGQPREIVRSKRVNSITAIEPFKDYKLP